VPGFRAFNRADQYRLIRLGQSQSRMLVAACHWYLPETDNFKDFMFWRDNTYPVKQHLLEFSRDFCKLHLDRVEAALMNTLIITATGKLYCSTFLICLYYVVLYGMYVSSFINKENYYFCADYPGLENASAIEDHRQTVLKAFRAYTTGIVGIFNIQ
jgi:hypothetical protein